MLDPWAAKACGSWLMMSSTRTLPVEVSASAEIAVTGLIDSRFGDAMRVPVTVTVCSSSALS